VTIRARASDTADRPNTVEIKGQGSILTCRTVVGVNVKKIVGLLAIALLIFFVVTQPTAAAGSIQSIGSTLADWANSITTFFTTLV
jgi:hypothetical protein